MHVSEITHLLEIFQSIVREIQTRNRKKCTEVPYFPSSGGGHCKIQSVMAYTLAEGFLYACPKLGYARDRSRTACFNEGFLKQAILGSKQLAEKPVDRLWKNTL